MKNTLCLPFQNTCRNILAYRYVVARVLWMVARWLPTDTSQNMAQNINMSKVYGIFFFTHLTKTAKSNCLEQEVEYQFNT